MGNGTPRLSSLGRALAVLERVLEDGGSEARGAGTISAAARSLGLPVATVHRHVATLADAGWLLAVGRGRYVAGPAMLSAASRVDVLECLAGAAQRPPCRTRRTAGLHRADGHARWRHGHLPRQAGAIAHALFTRVGLQLEAYCSGIGKVLLAALPQEDLARYLAAGPFIALTPATITDPALIAAELDAVRRDGFAQDREEIAPGLSCLAVPLRDAQGRAIAAISASFAMTGGCDALREAALPVLREAAADIENALFPRR